jgi:sulfur carrier protein
MDVTVDVKGEAVSEVSVSAGATYADLLEAVDLSPQEATVLVDERPVPADQPVASEDVTVLRLVKGG